ncbi:MAG: helix-turn-helix domain-containing protein [Lachnospiraceae bacterium]|nr:helix-turn-helix domain-containing protein [Lachnospiraceae bacterium]
MSLETLTKICEPLDCDISDVIQLEHGEKCTDSTGNKLYL